MGLTQDSKELKSLLQSIIVQINSVLNRPADIPNDFNDLIKEFHGLINGFPRDCQLVLLLDSIHRLKPDYNAHQLQWLPTSLPPNVKLIISSLPHAHGIFTRIKTEIIRNHQNFLELLPLGEEKALQIVLYWLQENSMCLTPQQAQILMDAFKRCSLPLYVGMVFPEIMQWRSFDVIEPDALGHSCESYLERLFDKLEHLHGTVVVKHSMALLTASVTGLSDMEMEDLLSLNNDVMDYVFRSGPAIIRRCPPYVWARLRNDLEPFLSLKVSDEFDVSYWVHEFYADFIRSRYLNDTNMATETHNQIADYYLGKWHAKPMMYMDCKGKPQVADRLVLSQPLTYTNCLGETKYNKRKYDQVPRHLYLAGRLDELNSKVLFNYDWLYNKIMVLSLQHILADLSLNPSTEATLLEGALRGAQSILDNDMSNMPVELSGRLLPYYQTHPNIRSLIDQCDRSGLAQCALVPLFNYAQVPGSPLQYMLEYVDNVDQICLVNSGRHLLIKSNTSQLTRKFDLIMGENRGDILTSYGRLHVTPDEQHLVIIDNEIEKAIKIHATDNGKFLGQLIPLNFINMKDRSKYTLGQISITNQEIAILITADVSYLCIASINECDFVKIICLEGKGSIVTISPNKKFVLCNIGNNVHAFSMGSYEQICLTQLDYKPTSLCLNKAGTKAYFCDDSSNIITVVSLTPEGYTQMVSKISLQVPLQEDCILEVKLSNNENLLLVRASRNILVYDITTDKHLLHIRKPKTIMAEFRLPKHSQAIPIIYTAVQFSSDDRVLMTSMFRNVQFWDLQSATPLTTNILAPVGIITDMTLSPTTNQILTKQQDASSIQVWNLQDYIMDVNSLDRLTSSIDRLLLTSDQRLCFATCTGSDEVGVIDMQTGLLSNLLTHESQIIDLVVTADGDYLFAMIEQSKAAFCNKIWSVKERKIVKEFGTSNGSAVALQKTNTIIHINQQSTIFRSPYSITIYTFDQHRYAEMTYDFVINYAVSKPVVTADDTYMALLTANDYDEATASYRNPSICAFYLKGRYMHSVWGKNELAPFLDERTLIALVPIKQKATEILGLYTSIHKERYGFLCLNLATGSLLRYSDDFMPGLTDIKSLHLSYDGSFCINGETGKMFDMRAGNLLSQINNKMSPVTFLNKCTCVVYYRGPNLIAERIADHKILGNCNVHVDICYVVSCADDVTVVVGCVDGTILSYMLIDEEKMDTETLLVGIPSRQVIVSTESNGIASPRRPSTSKSWDHSMPPLPRLASVQPVPSDREILRKIRPIYRACSNTNSVTSSSSFRSSAYPVSATDRSKTCIIM